ncbi:hypothetical protein HDU97_008710 [Phlyctochytrium planicorne]|nr:hypothetical protein HDU97_008710 [Phlyctochytrium planicorne]
MSLGVLGTHGAFLLLLPPLFWVDFGEDHGESAKEFGRGFVICLLFGVYASSLVKDFLCLPRPTSPPVRRMSTKASIALEYGFPSSHSTNAASIAAYTIYHLIYRMNFSPSSSLLDLGYIVVLASYPLLMGVSRILTGMHSFLDVFGGWVLGAGLCWLWWSGLGAFVENWISTGSHVPLVTIALLLFSIYIHPHPEGPCPCFEDSVASISVVAGVIIGTWRHGPTNLTTSIPIQNTTFTTGLARFLIGITATYTFRKLAKAICKQTFSRFLAPSDSKISHSNSSVQSSCTCAVESPKASRKNSGEQECGVCGGIIGATLVSEHASCADGKSVYIIKKVTVGTLTDGVVYGGIGILAVDLLPLLFRTLRI